MSDEKIQQLEAKVTELEKTQDESRAVMDERMKRNARAELEEVRKEIGRKSIDRIALLDHRQSVTRRINELDEALQKLKSRQEVLAEAAGDRTPESPDTAG